MFRRYFKQIPFSPEPIPKLTTGIFTIYCLLLRRTRPVMERDEEFMQRALALAEEAGRRGEVPVGAVVVLDNRIVGFGYNRRESTQSPIAHAEILAIEEARAAVGFWRLENCELFVTLEPCVMCCGAIVQARIRRVVFGARDPKGGAAVSLYALLSDPRLNHRCEVIEGVLAEECGRVLSDFFRRIRAAGRPADQE